VPHYGDLPLLVNAQTAALMRKMRRPRSHLSKSRMRELRICE
jgi:hypothetical protein